KKLKIGVSNGRQFLKRASVHPRTSFPHLLERKV
ncbi:unnamed protein product, partial [marine sediment metagenome]